MTEQTKERPTATLINARTILAVAALLAVMLMGYCATRFAPGAMFGRNETKITNELVVQEIRAVAKLVSSEATVRDVIVYENTWYGSTKRSLVVVTGRLLAGIDLSDNPEVKIDHEAKRIHLVIPGAKLIAVETTDMHTYDERGGLWNPFTREDREAIQRQARAQLTAAGSQMELVRHANESATRLLAALLAKDGYTVDVTIRGK